MTPYAAARSVVVSDRQVAQAVVVAAAIATSQPHPFDLVDEDGWEHRVPAELAEVLRGVLGAIADGSSIMISPTPTELTTTAAANELGVSRPKLMKMIRNGEIEAHKVGSHTRLRTDDVRAVQRRWREQRRVAFAELREFEEGLDLGDR